jgi:uncharacterized membrane protein
MRAFLSDRRGSAVTIFAFSAMVMSVMTAIVMNQVSFYLEKRKLQAAVDMTAMMIMQSGNITEARAMALLEEQMGQPMEGVTVVQGNYTPDAALAAGGRFLPNVSPFNAVQVDAQVPATKVMLGSMMPDDLQIGASARAARRTSVSLVVGSRLVRLDGGLSEALLDATVGYSGKLTVMDYNSLAGAQIDAIDFLQALNVEADVQAVTFNDVLSAPVSVGEIVDAMAATTDDGNILAILNKAAPAGGTDDVILSEMIDLGSMTNLPIDALLSGQAMPLGVGEILTGSAALADGNNQVGVNLNGKVGGLALANVSLDIGEKPQVLSYVGRAREGAEVSTSQFRLEVGALGGNPLTAVKLDVTMAAAEIEVDDIQCKADGTADVTLLAMTEAATVGLKASLLPKINVALGSKEKKSMEFTHADIQAGVYKPVRSGLGLQLGPLSIAQKLLFNPVDELLEDLGLHVAEADVKVVEATCGSVGLVH